MEKYESLFKGNLTLLIGITLIALITQGVKLPYVSPRPIEVRWNLIYLTVTDVGDVKPREISKIPIWEVFYGVDLDRRIRNIEFKDAYGPKNPTNSPDSLNTHRGIPTGNQ